MKKLLLSTLTVAVLAGFSGALWQAWGQGGGSPGSQSSVPHRVGLIDMAHVFKEYDKFEALRERLKEELIESDNKAKAIAQEIATIQEKMKNGPYSKGSPEYIALETKHAQKTSELETFRKVAQRDFLRKESQIYHSIYLEATEAVKKYAEIYNYTLIIRFNREELDSDDPSKLIQGMNRQVVYYRPDDDVTLSVVDYLNRKYAAQTGTPSSRQSTAPRGNRQN